MGGTLPHSVHIHKISLCIKHLREKFNTKKKIQGEHLGSRVKKPFLGVLSRPKRLKVWVHDPQDPHPLRMQWRKLRLKYSVLARKKIKLFFFFKKNTEIRKGKECSRKKNKRMNTNKRNTKWPHEEKQIKKKLLFHPNETIFSPVEKL